jgi:hypothetical protein
MLTRIIRYGFFDTYFDALDQAKETVEGYDADFKDGGMHADPLTFGTTDAEHSVRDPREYFLFVFHARIKQVLREWEEVFSNLQKSVQAYEQVSYAFVSISMETSHLFQSYETVPLTEEASLC